MAYKYKIKEEEGHSKYYPGGKTPGLTTSVMNKILKNIADSGDKDKEVKNKLKEETNPTDIISVDVPLFIRLLEYSREDAKTDMDLHDVAENIIRLSAEGEPLTMANYDDIVGVSKGEMNENIDDTIKKLEALIRKQFDVVEFKAPSKRPLSNEEFLMIKVNNDTYGGPQSGLGKFIKRWTGVEATFVDNQGTNKVYWVPLEKIESANIQEDGGGSVSNAAGGYLGKYAYKLPKKQPKLEEETEAPKPNAKNPGATLGAGPAAGKSGVSKNAYVKQFKYKVVPQTAEGTYVQKGSGMEVKKLF
jgi:hypothetical protein